jgi:hypothetical protein
MNWKMSGMQKPENYFYYDDDDAVGGKEMTVKWKIAKKWNICEGKILMMMLKEEEEW